MSDPHQTSPPITPSGYLGPGLRVLRSLGAGGQGKVVLAEDETLDRQVAVKFLASGAEGVGKTEFARRLRREARAMARVRHPSVVQVFDVGEVRGRPYLVMEYISGETMEERARAAGGVLDLGEALPLLEQIGQGLDAVHAAGLAHGDLQPTNVLLGADHRARVADFGLAFLSGGTAHYMAPELQDEGPHDVEARQRADLYALGVIAHELLAGERPFEAPDRARVLIQHRHKTPPSLQERRPDLPATLVATVDACLAKDPEARPSAGTVARNVADAIQRLNRPTFRRLLLVDDDAHFRALVATHVSDAFDGIRVVEVDGGEAAIAACHREPFDVVVLDLHMPGVNGVELVAALRTEQHCPKLIVLTGRGSAGDWALLRNLGVSALLAKPLEPPVLQAELQRLLYP